MLTTEARMGKRIEEVATFDVNSVRAATSAATTPAIIQVGKLCTRSSWLPINSDKPEVCNGSV